MKTASQRRAVEAYGKQETYFFESEWHRRNQDAVNPWAVVFAISLGMFAAAMTAAVLVSKYF